MSKLSLKDEILLENETRNELLQHFSSKSSNQAVVILSVALVFFAWVQSLQYIENVQNSFFKSLWYVLPLELIFFVSLRAFGRLVYWGMLADAVIRVKMIDANKYNEFSLLPHEGRSIKINSNGNYLPHKTFTRLQSTQYDNNAFQEV